MLYSGTLYRAELYDDHAYPYTSVKEVYENNKNRFPDKHLIVTNAHWYNGVNPVGNYKVKGEILSQEWTVSMGFAWTDFETPAMGWDSMVNDENFIGTIAALWNGEVLDTSSQVSGVQRSTTRTWWGFTEDNTCYIEVTNADEDNSKYTLEEIKTRMIDLKIVNGLVLDGSGSSQWYDGENYIDGDGRTLYSFLLLWFDVASSNTGANTDNGSTSNDTPNTVTFYRVQCGAFWVQSNATKLKEKLIAAGYKAFILKDWSTWPYVYRVQLGAFYSYERAKNFVAQLQEAGYKAFVVRVEAVS